MTQRSLLWRAMQAACRTFTTLCFDLKVWGAHHVPADGGALLVANHESFLDPILVAVQLRRPVSFMVRSGLFGNPFFSRLISSLHAFPVRQGEGDVGAIKETIRRLKEGHLLNIYPEGSRTEDGELGPIEPGVGLVIRRAGVPVVPVAIQGSFDAWPKWRKIFRPHPIRVMYGPPMRLDGKKPAEIVAAVDAALRELIAELRRRRARETSR